MQTVSIEENLHEMSEPVFWKKNKKKKKKKKKHFNLSSAENLPRVLSVNTAFALTTKMNVTPSMKMETFDSNKLTR